MLKFTSHFLRESNSFKISAKKKDHQKILDLLLQEGDCFVINHVRTTSQFLEIDSRALEILQEKPESAIRKEAKKERELAEKLKARAKALESTNLVCGITPSDESTKSKAVNF